MTPVKTIQNYRHDAKNNVVKALHLISAVLVDSESDMDLDLVRVQLGEGGSYLVGRQGLTQDQQVEILTKAREVLKAAGSSLASLLDAVEDADSDHGTLLNIASVSVVKAVRSVTSAKNHAANRDFADHQAEKHIAQQSQADSSAFED